MKKLLYSLLLLTPLGAAYSQNYNPFVNSGIINPAPLASLESAGTGTVTFNIGNSGSNVMNYSAGNELIVKIVLSKGEPNNANPIAAIGGTFANKFAWTYNGTTKTYTGTQSQNIGAELTGSGSITVAYKVAANSPISGGTNGFYAQLTIPGYTNVSNASGDDFVSSYTWTTFRVSGNVFNDVTGMRDNLVNGGGTDAGGTVKAYLVDSLNNTVAISSVTPTGTFSFTGINPKSYTVRITTQVGSVGSPAPSIVLPTNWEITGEGTGSTSDGTPNGITPLQVVLADVGSINFGIQQRPTGLTQSAPIQPNPGGTINVSVPATIFGGTDPTPGTVDSIRLFGFPANATTITVDGTQYTSATFPPLGLKLKAPGGVPVVPISVDPVSGAITVSIPFYAIDNAGFQSSSTGTANLPFSNVTIAGNVFNDVNGMKNSLVDGTGTNAGGGLFAVLLNSANQVVANDSLITGGAFSFGGLEPGTFSVRLSTTKGVVGGAAPAVSLPTNWVNTGEGLTAAGDGTVNGIINVTLTTAGITGANFGIEQRPFALTLTAAPVLNPGTDISVTVPTATFGGTDAGPGTVDSIRFTTMPTNAASLTVGTTTFTTIPAGGITIYAPGGVPSQVIKVDPNDNAATPDTLIVGIPYYTMDNAGVLSNVPGVANMRFIVPDLTPNIVAQPSIMTGTTTFFMTISVTELYKVATSGQITVFIPRDSRLSFNYDNTLTTVGFTSVNNAVWSFDNSHPQYYIFTSNTSIPGWGSSTFGMEATFVPGNTNGSYTLTASILSGSGSEVKTTNNNDAEKIDYFVN